jgi:spore germination protein GerM
MSRRLRIGLLVLLLAGLGAWGVSYVLERVLETPRGTVTPAVPDAPATAHITATLFHVSEDGLGLVRTQREVPLADDLVEQGRRILVAQLGDMPPPGLASAFPPGTSLRAFYVTDRGDAFVDLSPDAAAGHPGGSQAELLTVYAIVHAVAANLPAVRRVQILVNGQEVDTLAGHVDLRHPLEPDPSLIVDAKAAAASGTP